MKIRILMLILLFVAATGAAKAQAPEPKLAPLMEQALSNLPGKEVLMFTVEFAPGWEDPVHRHHAPAFVYVLEGSIIMAVKGGKEVTLTPGQTFYEGPDDVHTIGRNASKTQTAKFIVFMIKDPGAPALVLEPNPAKPK